MTPVFAIVLLAGILGLLVWVALTAVADTVEGWTRVDPEALFGSRGRFGLAAALGFGLAGMSATFAGWSGAWPILASVAGAAFSIGVAARYGPRPRSESD